MDSDDVRKRIEGGIPGASVEVIGEQAHFSALVVSTAFEGKTRVEQHQMVYALLKDEMSTEMVHALALKTCTPAELAQELKSQES